MKINSGFRIRILGLAVGLLLVSAPSALAQGSSEGVYEGPGGEVQTQVASGSGDGASADDGAGGGLPFTGLDLAAALGGGLILLGTGMVLSRLVTRDSTA